MAHAGAFQRLIMMSGRNKLPRETVPKLNRAIDIALNSKSKLEELRKILGENPGRKTIIFTQHNKLVYDISDKFLIPFITYKSGKEESKMLYLDLRKEDKAIVTSKVLDEGVDVPDAEWESLSAELVAVENLSKDLDIISDQKLIQTRSKINRNYISRHT